MNADPPCSPYCHICAPSAPPEQWHSSTAYRWSPELEDNDPVIPSTLQALLPLPYERPPKSLVGNSRAHWRQRSADTQQVRADVMRLAQLAGLHQLRRIEHITAELVWAPGDRRRRDADNLWPLLKVCCDAIARGPRRDWVGLELVPDDTPEHMTKLAPRIDPPPAKGMWLVLTLDFPKAGAA